MMDKDVKKLLRASQQRLTSAEILARPQNQMYLDSMYLAGYSVECSLKALILAQVSRQKRGDFVRARFRGAIAHEYEFLKALLKELNVSIPKEISKVLRQVASWSTDLRYEVGTKRPTEAKVFLDSAGAILDWVKRRL